MQTMRLLLLLLLFTLLATSAVAASDDSGRIDGRVTRHDGSPLPGVTVTIGGTSFSTITDVDGRYVFNRVPAGTHSLTFTLASHSMARPEVAVAARSTTTIDQTVDWKLGIIETVTVRAVSRRPERIVEAPAAVTSLTAAEIARQASHGQLPKLFEFTPGVDITQINASEFLVSARGFNSSLNRRMPVLIDGREVGDPFIGATEWSTIPFPLDELAAIEVVRGPTSALYGANATGGIVNLTTLSPRDDPGGRLRLTAGELDSGNVDFRWAGALGRDWYAKVTAGRHGTDGFSVSRQTTTEYAVPCGPGVATDCIPLDGVAIPDDDIDIMLGGLRVDKVLQNGSVFTLEGGTADYDGQIFISGVGRGQIQDVERPWARVNYSAERWNLLATYDKRNAEALNLTNGNPFLMDAHNMRLEFQTNQRFLDDRIQLVAGGSWFDEKVDSNVISGEIDTDEQSLFSQVDWQINDHLKLVGALRWDDSTLHDAEISPKGSLVVSLNPRHTLRFTYNEAFQVPTYGELYLRFPLPDVNLLALDDICKLYVAGGCGLTATTPNFILGNENLGVEQVETFEVGYKGVLGSKAFLTVDYYDTKNENFVTPLLPQVGTPLGRINTDYGPWQGSAEAESTIIDPNDCLPVVVAAGQTVADCVRATVPALTNLDGESIVMPLSQTTFGQVDTRGVDVGLGYYFNDAWKLSFSYSWFDFDLVESSPEVETVLIPNAPKNKTSLGLFYVGERWNASLRGRWVDDFRWINSAVFQGDVESFTSFDLTGNYDLTGNWQVGINVANLFDEEHWEAWGAELLGRRALAHVAYNW